MPVEQASRELTFREGREGGRNARCSMLASKQHRGAELPGKGFWEELQLGTQPPSLTGGSVGGSELCSLPSPGMTVRAEDAICQSCAWADLPPLFFWCPAAEESPCESRVCQNGGSCQAANGMATCLCQPGYTGADCQRGRWQEQAPGGRDCDTSRFGKLHFPPALPPAVVSGGERSVLLVALNDFFLPAVTFPLLSIVQDGRQWVKQQCPRAT